MKIKILLLPIYFVFVCRAFGTPVSDMPPRLGEFINGMDSISATFNQVKVVPDSTKQFVSTGRVKIKRGLGFVWIQDTPKAQTFIATLDKYCNDGRDQEMRALPYFSRIKQMLDDLLNGDIKRMLGVFDVDYVENGTNGWQLTATPKISAMADFIQDVVMRGTTRDLNRVIITYQNGTVIIINFKRMIREIPDGQIRC